MNEKYEDVLNKIPNKQNIISYINNIQTTDVKDIKACDNIYDDNIAVQSLGYNNCTTAYSDYLIKNLDVNNKYGYPKSLSEMCPVSCKTDNYKVCITNLLQKYKANSDIITNVNNSMMSSINNRIQVRNNVLNNIDTDMVPLLYNTDQNNFNTDSITKGYVDKYKNDKIDLVNNYYQDRYNDNGLGFGNTTITMKNSSLESFSNMNPTPTSNPKISTPLSSNLDSYTIIKQEFFGYYKPIKSQFIAFDDLYIKLGNSINTSSYPTVANNPALPNKPKTTIYTTTAGLINTNQPNTDIILSIISVSNNLEIIYNLSNIQKYNNLPNAISMVITGKTIVNNSITPANLEPLQSLLTVLGMNVPTKLIISYNEFTSTENIIHRTYKLTNDNLDTIILLNKES